MTTLCPALPIPPAPPSAPIALAGAPGRAQMSFIHPAMVETIALSPEPRAPSRAESGPPPDFFDETPASDVEAQHLPQVHLSLWPPRVWEPLASSALMTLTPSLCGAGCFALFDALQVATDSTSCPVRALNLSACAWGALSGALLTGLEYKQASRVHLLALLTLRATMLSAGVAASVDIFAAAQVMVLGATEPSCATPIIMRSSGSIAAFCGLASEFAGAPPEHLYAAGRILAAPLRLTGQAAGLALRRVSRRRWH